MGDLIQFPAKRIIRRNPTTQQIESDAKRKKAKELYFIEQLTEEIVLHAIHVLQDNAIKMKEKNYSKYLATTKMSDLQVKSGTCSNTVIP